MKKVHNLEIYIDGASRGNPGDAGAGVVIEKDGLILREIGKYVGKTTNNIAEYKALILGLKEANKFNATSIKIYSDSQLLVNQLTGEYRVKSDALRELYSEVEKAAKNFKEVHIEKIPREKNKKADKLANKAITKSKAIFSKNSNVFSSS